MADKSQGKVKVRIVAVLRGADEIARDVGHMPQKGEDVELSEKNANLLIATREAVRVVGEGRYEDRDGKPVTSEGMPILNEEDVDMDATPGTTRGREADIVRATKGLAEVRDMDPVTGKTGKEGVEAAEEREESAARADVAGSASRKPGALTSGTNVKADATTPKQTTKRTK